MDPWKLVLKQRSKRRNYNKLISRHYQVCLLNNNKQNLNHSNQNINPKKRRDKSQLNKKNGRHYVLKKTNNKQALSKRVVVVVRRKVEQIKLLSSKEASGDVFV